MKSLLFCMLGLAMTACAPRKAGNVNNGSDELAMLVGTYTDGNSKGIYTFRFNQETGLATSLSSIEVLNRLISSLQKMEGLSMPSAK